METVAPKKYCSGWYDNEMGYTHTLVEHVIKTGATIK